MPYRNYINLKREEWESPVYRIMPKNRLLQCFNEKQLVLVPPKMWDDPFENLLLKSKLQESSTGEIGDMKPIENKIYSQCWTQHRETDAMWRIYSPGKNGVKVKTTPRKLLDALLRVKAGESAELCCFIGKVQYMNQEELKTSLKGLDLFNTNGSGIAESLLYKREGFSHEKEIRIIHTNGTGKIFPVSIEPNDMFEEIIFDPRADQKSYETFRLAEELNGFSENIAQSTLYRPPEPFLLKI